MAKPHMKSPIWRGGGAAFGRGRTLTIDSTEKCNNPPLTLDRAVNNTEDTWSIFTVLNQSYFLRVTFL